MTSRRHTAKEHHPDKNINDPEASKRFQEIGAAYEILSDSTTREIYDEHGLEGLTGAGEHGGPGGMDPADIFAEMFGGGGGFSFSFGGPGMGGRGGPGRSRKGQDSVIPYEVTLEDLYNGKHVKMNMEKEAICAVCNGCKKCKGKKTVKEKKRQEIFVEKGMTDRQRIILHGEGDQSPGSSPGDVIFSLKMTQNNSFERSGNDLLAKVQITLSEALLGFERIILTHLDGRGIRLSSPSGKVIRPGDTIILRGEGMPQYKSPNTKGDLYVAFDVEFPDEGWSKSVDREALETLLPPKKPELEPRPSVVDVVAYEEGDFVDSAFSSFQFGAEDDEEAWTDDDEDADGEPPECRTQ
ncbi:hypothetical protein EW145_g1017 [Phellinidium pouzarii]|uniref:J domain-containing protein n=1 Tax=Phellinidium pouzarii TaxID=167371 RepID=A0A4S4LG19_9AGAM|nr:hypothetical protein EW145_g1017 [Phellinidium pouzarii]